MTASRAVGEVADDLALGLDAAAQRLEEGVAAVALEPGQADQLAGLDLEVDRRAVRAQPQAAHAEHRRAATVGDRREPVVRPACRARRSRSSAAPAAGASSGRGRARPRSAGPHDRDAVADLLDLVHAVRDEDDADAGARELADQLEEAVARGDVERRGRLVEDQDLRVRARARARCRTPAGPTARAPRRPCRGRRRARAACRASAWRGRPSRAARRCVVHDPVGAEPDVVEHRARLGDEDLLEDREDAAALRLARRPDRRDELAVELDLARRPACGRR